MWLFPDMEILGLALMSVNYNSVASIRYFDLTQFEIHSFFHFQRRNDGKGWKQNILANGYYIQSILFISFLNQGTPIKGGALL